MVPNWVPKPPQNGAKLGPRSIKPGDTRSNGREHENTVKTNGFLRFLVGLGVKNQPKIDKKSIQKGFENKMQVKIDFGWLLDRFLVDFGTQVGGKLGPSWHQNLKKSDAKMISKNGWKTGYSSEHREPGSWPLRIQ